MSVLHMHHQLSLCYLNTTISCPRHCWMWLHPVYNVFLWSVRPQETTGMLRYLDFVCCTRNCWEEADAISRKSLDHYNVNSEKSSYSPCFNKSYSKVVSGSSASIASSHQISCSNEMWVRKGSKKVLFVLTLWPQHKVKVSVNSIKW